MSKKRPSASSSGKSRRKPTPKQRRFAVAYVDPKGANGNGTLAARMAGYQGNANQLAVQASVNLRNTNVQQTIRAMLDAMVEPALHRLAETLDAMKVRSFLTKDGDIISSQPEPDNKARLDAVKIVFGLRESCGKTHACDQQDYTQIRPWEDQGSAPTSKEVSEMEPADRMAFREAGEIEEHLVEVQRELAGNSADES